MAKSTQVQQIIKRFFDDKKYSYDIEQKETWILSSSFQTLIKEGKTFVAFVVHKNDINVVATFSQTVPKELHNVIAEIFMGINRYLKRGHFYLDFSVGSVNFKMWNSTKGKITDKDIDELLLISLGSVETVMGLIHSLITEELTAEQVIQSYVKGGNSE